MRAFAAGLLLLAVAAQATARGADRRVAADPNMPPWNAVAKVQTTIGGRCSGVLVAPDVVLSAAHCLYNPRTRAMLQPVSLHVLFGFGRDTYRWHRLVRHFTLGPGFDMAKGAGQASDWARLELAEPVPVEPLPLAAGVDRGTAVALAGYNQDRSQILLADQRCHVLRTRTLPQGARLLVHDCAGTRGTSGGPLLVRHGDGWAVAAINIAAGPAQNLALQPALGPSGDPLTH